MIKGNLSMYMKSLLRFSLVTVSMSTMSLLSVNIQRSPEFTLLRLSRQKGHDCDLALLQQQKNTCENTYSFQLNKRRLEEETNDAATTILLCTKTRGRKEYENNKKYIAYISLQI